MFFERSIRDEVETRSRLEAELAGAIENNELELFYQPQVSLKDGKLGRRGGVEFAGGIRTAACCRPRNSCRSSSTRRCPAGWRPGCWKPPAGRAAPGAISATAFVSALQTSRRRSFRSATFRRTLPPCWRGPASSLSCSSSRSRENILLADDDSTRDTFRRIQDLGVRIVFDDFGTGYASLTYLKKFALNGLKIDQSFVHELRGNTDDAAIVSGHDDQPRQDAGLASRGRGHRRARRSPSSEDHGMRRRQGYHFGVPMPAGDFTQQFLIAYGDRCLKAGIA